MIETRSRDQWDPPSAMVTERASFIGRKICVVWVKSGRADLMVRGSGVCINMKAMLGRRRMICEEGYLQSCSRSRYLGSGVRSERGRSGGEGGDCTLPRRLLSAKGIVSNCA